MNKKRLISLAVASAIGLLSPLSSNAFGLGEIQTHSALNEPLNATIPVTALKADEADNLVVVLSSNTEYEKAGLEKTFLLLDLKFKVVQSASGTQVQVTSKKAIKEPLLDLLVTASTGKGRLIREYTLLLDPPKHIFNKATPAPVKQVSQQKTQATSSSASNTTSYTYGEQASSTKSSFNGSEYGPTTSRDTLWNVALATRPDKSISINQMMMALLNANPDAFRRNNINGLKKGQVLSIPSFSDINSLSKSDATKAVAAQNTAWKNRNTSKAAASTTVSNAETATTNDAEQAATAEVAAIEQNDVNTETSSRLKLVMPTDDESINDAATSPLGGEKVEQLSEQLTLAQETIEAQNQENVQLKARMDAMEEQLETMKRMISLYDPDMAKLQNLLEEEQAQNDSASLVEDTLAALEQANVQSSVPVVGESDDVADETPTTNVDTQTNDIEEAVVATTDDSLDAEILSAEEEMVSDDMSHTSFDDTTAQANEELEQSAEQVQDVDDVVATVADTLNLDEREVQSAVDQVKTFIAQNQLTTALGALLLLLILWLIIRRKNHEVTWDEAVDKSGLKKEEETVPVAMAAVEDETPEVEEITEPAEKTVADLIAQADMFVGYADYAQARTSLEKAQAMEPESETVTEKMLFVLYKQQHKDSFMQLLSDAAIDVSLPRWNDVAEWARELDPDNAAFKHEVLPTDDVILSEPEETVLEAEEATSEDDAIVLASPTLSTQDDESVEPTVESANLDFDIATPTVETNESEAVEFDLDMSDAQDDVSIEPVELDLSDSFESNVAEAESEQVPAVEDDLAISLDLDDATQDDDLSLEIEGLGDNAADDELKISEQDLASATADLEVQNQSDEELEFEIDDFDEVDEAETKLDLANAYIDMGDPAGARSILEEVMEEGTDAQQLRAKAVLDSIRTA
jgi:pilus assembly protein FimV